MKKFILTACILIVIGAVMVGAGAAMDGFDDEKPNVIAVASDGAVPDTDGFCVLTRDFAASDVTGISASMLSADITVQRTDADAVSVDYFTDGKHRIEVSVTDGILNITEIDERKWYEMLDISFTGGNVYEAVVSVPGEIADAIVNTQSGYVNIAGIAVSGDMKTSAASGSIFINSIAVGGSLAAGTKSGSVEIDDAKATGGAEFTTSSGDIQISDTEIGGDVKTSAASGCINLSGLTASGKITAEAASGRIDADYIAADALEAKASSGDVSIVNGTFAGAISLETKSGSSSITDSAAGSVVIKTTSGDASVWNVDTNDMDISTFSGEVSGVLVGAPDEYDVRTSTNSGSDSLSKLTGRGGARYLDVNTASGDIELEFESEE